MRRPRVRYASDAEVKRAFRLAREEGVQCGGFTLNPDGGITVLDTRSALPFGLSLDEASPDQALAAWEAKYGDSRRT